jgi:hypothetical protein
MHIGQLPSQIKNRKRMWQINAICLVFVFALSLFMFFAEEEERVSESIKSPQRKKEAYEQIGWGPLALNELRSQGPLPFLTKELIILGKNNRPERQAREGFFLLGLKSSQEEIIVAERQPIFLMKGEDNKWHFSLSKTPLCLFSTMAEGNKVVVHVISSLDEGREGDFQLKCFDKTGDLIENTPYVKALKSAKFWGHDLLIQNYGGSDYRDLLKKNKIEVEGKVYFVGEDDLLMWKDGRWHLVSLKNIEPLTPIAKVISSIPTEICLQIWDESGFHTLITKKAVERVPKIGHKLEELFSSIRMRTPSEITCLMGKRRVILKEGDWWLKMDVGWKKLKTMNDIEDYLDHRLRGELFIFESIVADKGKVILKGTSFDVMRTDMQPLSMTASLSKKPHSSSKKENKEPHLIAKTDGTRFQKAEGLSSNGKTP